MQSIRAIITVLMVISVYCVYLLSRIYVTTTLILVHHFILPLCIDDHIPPNSNIGYTAITHLLNTSSFQHSLFNLSHSFSHYDYNLCNNEPFYFSDRPFDWLNYSYSSTFQHKAITLLASRNPKCVKLVGFFQNYPLLCRDDIRRLWSTRLVGTTGDTTYRYTYSILYTCVDVRYKYTCICMFAYCGVVYLCVYCIDLPIHQSI